MKKCIVTVLGKDTVGIVAKVCTYLAENKINILDISQTIVQGYSPALRKISPWSAMRWQSWEMRSACASTASGKISLRRCTDCRSEDGYYDKYV